MKALYKYPQAAFPYAQLVEENRRPRPTRSGVRAARHRRLRRRAATSTCSSSTRRPAPDDILIRITRRQSRPRGGDRCMCCRRSGFATRGPGAWRRGGRASRGRAPAGRRRTIDVRQRELRRRWRSCARARRSCCSPRTRRTHERLFGAENDSPYVKDAFHDYVVGGATDAVNPERSGTKAAARYRTRRSGGRVGHRSGCASPSGSRVAPEPVRRGVRRRFRTIGSRRRTSSTRTLADAGSRPRTRARVQRQAFAGMLWSKQFYHYDVGRLAARRPGRAAAAAGAPARPQQRLDAPVQRRRHLDARQVGVPVVRRLGPRLPLRSRWRSIDPDFAKEQLAAAAARVVHAPERAVAGLRVGLRRREPARPRLGGVARLQDRQEARRRRPHVPRARLPQAAAELHVVGQSQGRRRQERLPGRLPRTRQHRRLRPQLGAARRAATSSSPTARAGWACTA